MPEDKEKTIVIPADRLISITVKEEESESSGKPDIEDSEEDKKEKAKPVDIREEKE